MNFFHLGRLGFRHDPRPPAYWVFAVSLFALMAAFLAASAIFLSYGLNPLTAYTTLLRATLFDHYGLAETVRRAVPLLLVGAGLAFAFRAQIWNIGAEGQILAGATAAAGVALFAQVPAPWTLPAMFAAGALAGAAWALGATVFNAEREIIATLMSNYVATYIVRWLIHGPWKGKHGFSLAYSDVFARAAWLPLIPGTRIAYATLTMALLAPAVLWFVLARTRLGFEIRTLGDNPAAARYAGMGVRRVTVVVMLVSGGLSGLAGVGEIAAIHHKLLEPDQISLGYGFTAITVAYLARGSMPAIGLSALLMGAIFASGDVLKISLGLPSRIADVFDGLILLALVACERLMYWRPHWQAAAPRAVAAPLAEPAPAETADVHA